MSYQAIKMRDLQYFNPLLWRLLILTFSLTILSSMSITTAIANTSLPGVEELNKKIERISLNSELSEEQRALSLNSLQQVLARVGKIQIISSQIARYTAALNNGPFEKVVLDAKISSYKKTELSDRLTNAPLAKIESLLVKEKILISELTNRNSAIDDEINNEKSIDLQKLLTEQRTLLKNTQADLEVVNPSPEDSAELLALSRVSLSKSYISMLEQQLLSRDIRLQLLESEKELIAKQLADSQLNLSALQNLVTHHRQSEAARFLTSAQEILGALSEVKSPVPEKITTIAENNVKRAEATIELISDHEGVLKALDVVNRDSRRIKRKLTSLTEQLKISQLESSAEFGAAVRIQRDNLIDLTDINSQLKSYEQQLTRNRLAQFRVDSERETDSELLLSNTKDTDAATIKTDRVDIDEITLMREQSLRQLSSGYLLHVGELSKLIAQLKAMNIENNRYTSLLDRQLIWMPSTGIFTHRYVVEGVSSISAISRDFNEQAFVISVYERIKNHAAIAILAIAIWLLLIVKRRRFIHLISEMKERVGKVNRDAFSLTFLAVLLTFLLALPGPLAMLVVAEVFNIATSVHQALFQAIIYAAIFYLLLRTLSQSLRENGLADLHFKWNTKVRCLLEKHLRWFSFAFIPLIFFVVWCELQSNALIRDGLGRLAWVIIAAITVIFIHRTHGAWKHAFSPASQSSDKLSTGTFSSFLLLFMVSSPLFLIFLSLSGYHYTSIKLGANLLLSVVIVIAGIYLFYLARRMSAISERRLALERALTKRAQSKKEERDIPDAGGEAISLSEDIDDIDLETISEHTETLLRMVAIIAIGSVLWNVWSDFFLAFQRLDDVYLWGAEEIIDGSAIAKSITLWDILLTIAVGVITFLAAKNITGFLEITILRWIDFAKGTNYTITTISRYIIVLTGSVIALKLLGTEWDKLQWLIAALSVGLGFGLQEIVANFVSGILILFERPIRIGDTVTVGDEFGTVSKIRIRATTIVDWDRKEVIIPNKTFITERLVNWTLTDPITRTIIKVGVAYGSDVALTEKCLYAIAHKNKKVLDDPAPAALFRSFGDSSLNFELRVFVKEMLDLAPVIHELHVAVEREFRRNNIEISFPQQDLHFDSKPLEIKLVDSNRKDPKNDE